MSSHDPSERKPNDAHDNPHRLAAGFIDATGSPLRLRYWRGEFHRYQFGAYRLVYNDDLRSELVAWTRAEFVRLNAAAVVALEMGGDGKKSKAPLVRPVTSRLIGDVLQALRGQCLLPASTDAPAWIDGASGPEPAGLLPMRNGILDLDALAAGRAGCLLPPSPSYFTTTAAPFAFDPAATAPLEWLRFLRDLWPDDSESIETLQEFFGYLLTPDTRQQKILFLLGPRRGGKGTIARVLGEFVDRGSG